MIRDCDTCGKPYEALRVTSKFCSPRCRYHKHLARENRVRIPDDLRYFVLRRDGFRCRYCGAEPARRELHVDHLVSVEDGGALTAVDNLVTTCRRCNLGKGSQSIDPGELPDG